MFKGLFENKLDSDFRNVWVEWSTDQKDFFLDFLWGLSKSPEGLDVLVKALLCQSIIVDIEEDRYFALPPLIKGMPQSAREQLLLDEDQFAILGILGIEYGDDGIIDQTICGASDPQQKIKLIAGYRYDSISVIKWLDDMTSEDRIECLKHENVIMSLGHSFFYDETKDQLVEHALDRWGAHQLRRVLHYAAKTLSDHEILLWSCIGPILYTDKEMGDFQAPSLPPLPPAPKKGNTLRVFRGSEKSPPPAKRVLMMVLTFHSNGGGAVFY